MTIALYTLSVALFVAMRTRMSISKAESWGLLALYASFVLWMGLESFGLVDTVPSLPT